MTRLAAWSLLAGLAVAAEPEMVRIPAGTFVMGRDDGPADERPGHRVALGAFEIDRLPVTNAGFGRAHAGVPLRALRARALALSA